MKVKEVYVDIENSQEIFSIIEKTLSTRPNTQIFVDNKLFDELKRNGCEHNVFHHNYMQGFHYEHDDEGFGGPYWLSLHIERSWMSDEIASVSFISNCNGYMQVVNFDSKKIKDYTHYCAGFEQLMLILTK